MNTLRLSLEQLLPHEQFVRETLRGLLRDPTLVEDAVQETWLRAWRRPPSALQEPRTWLARTARNLAIGRWRSERRRMAREQAVATAGEAESAATSLRRVEMCQQVVAAILALDEPYRTVVLLRYEQGLDFAAIARRLGRSPATVRSQLSRAHDQLRQRLDREFGGREAWAAIAVAFVGAPAVVPTGGVVVAAVALASALAVGVWTVWPGSDLAPPALPGPTLDAVAAVAVVPDASPTPRDDERARVAAERPQEPRAANALREPAVLFDRSWYEDFELATFSFEHGLRDDPGLRVTRNDWDLVLDSDKFRVGMVVDDHSLIADLGPLEPAVFGTVELPSLLPATEARVLVGHAYYVGTRDDDTTLATVLFVREHRAGRTTEFDWFTTDGTGRWQGSVADPGNGRAWVGELTELYRRQLAALDVRALARPEVVLQLRGGAGGGNLRRLDLAGEINGYVEGKSEQRLDVLAPPAADERCLAWSTGGTVPVGSTFVITRIEYRGGCRGDGNGRGAFRVVVNDHALVDRPTSSEPIAGIWTGRVGVANGAEHRTFFEIGNSSWGEVQISGAFEAGQGLPGFGGTNAGFGKPPVVDPVPPRRLGVPEVRLQVRTGAVGGNACRFDLRARQSSYVDRVESAPLDFSMPLPPDQRCVAYGTGGLLEPGVTFVVTSVRFRARVGEGHGAPLRIVVAGVELVKSGSAATAAEGEQAGEFEIPAGEETRTYVEVGNSSYVDVVLSGRFEYR